MRRQLTFQADNSFSVSEAISQWEKKGSAKDLDLVFFQAMSGFMRTFVFEESELLPGQSLTAVMLETGLFESMGEARRGIQGNSVTVNNIKIADAKHVITLASCVCDNWIMLGRGKSERVLLFVSMRGINDAI